MSTDALRDAAKRIVDHMASAMCPREELSLDDVDQVARAVLSVEPQAEPEGWQLVPKEPTREMLRAAVQVKEGPAVYKVMSFAGLAVLEEDTKDEYTAALAAAPSPAMPVEPDKQLCTFYGVDTFPALVEAMEHHIKKLQAKLPQNDMPAATKTRFA